MIDEHINHRHERHQSNDTPYIEDEEGDETIRIVVSSFYTELDLGNELRHRLNCALGEAAKRCPPYKAKDLAQATGKLASEISKIRSGHRPITLEFFLKAMYYLGKRATVEYRERRPRVFNG